MKLAQNNKIVIFWQNEFFFRYILVKNQKKHCQITFNCVFFADTIENRNDIKTMFEKIFVETHVKKKISTLTIY